jgi:UDP-N-acetylmuramate: L-alanyl-gamma-D-glutamyl-meso-diaminopimelate ligase
MTMSALLLKSTTRKILKIPYETPSYSISHGSSILKLNGQEIPLQVFGQHNLQNLVGAISGL